MKFFIFFIFFTQILYSYTLKLQINQTKTNVKINNINHSDKLKNKSLSIDLKNGEYNIEVCKKNYKCFNQKIWIMDASSKLNIDLEPLKSSLLIVSNNINSIILVNGKQIDKNKILEFSKSQTIEIEEKKEYFNSSKMKFKINLGDDNTLNLPNLKAIKKVLNIKAINPYKNLSVRLNGKEICNTLVCKESLSFGNYNLYISAKNFYPFEKIIKITDKNIDINYELKKIPKDLQFSVELSYIYDRLLGGYPELDVNLKIKDKINFKLGVIYVVNFSNDSEYYGLILGSSYDIYKKDDKLRLYAGMDFIFSKYIDNNLDYLLNGVGLNLGANFKIIDDLFVNFEITNRMHYTYHNDYYNILGKIGVFYSF